MDVDNAFTGCGLHGVYDSKFDRVIISKLDYIPLSDEIKYNSVTQEFYIDYLTYTKTVELTDPTYFCNKSWTLSYNVNTGGWISFHSYIPNYYIAENNYFYSGINTGCDLEAIAFEETPPATTTTTTTSTTTTVATTTTSTSSTTSTSTSSTSSTTTTTTTTTSTTTTLAPNVALDIRYEQGTWKASADHNIGTTLNFTVCSVLGYITSSTCTGGADDSDSINGLVLNAGTSYGQLISGGLSCIDVRCKLNTNVTINGTIHASGSTFTIGGQSITLTIHQTVCSIYSC